METPVTHLGTAQAATLRAHYPLFSYDAYTITATGHHTVLCFTYSLGTAHTFTHQVIFEHMPTQHDPLTQALAFHVGLAEMFSYWKLTCSPRVEIRAGSLSDAQCVWWHDLFIKGMGEYYYKNHIDFTAEPFITVQSLGPRRDPEDVSCLNPSAGPVLVPIGGGKDSAVTLEILQQQHAVLPLIVYPTTPASVPLVAAAQAPAALIVRRELDPHMLRLTRSGAYLNGHIPYSAALAFIFLFAAAAQQAPYIVVSNERSAEEGNVVYHGRVINHQYSKTFAFELLLQDYIRAYLTPAIRFFSFLRPLNELQIGKLFATMPHYFAVFRSCNRHQQHDSWCGTCPKCVSVALSLMPWLGRDALSAIMGSDPLSNPLNHDLLDTMTNPARVKPFECVVSTEEAQVCLEFIAHGLTPRVARFLAPWGQTQHIPEPFLTELKHYYAHA